MVKQTIQEKIAFEKVVRSSPWRRGHAIPHKVTGHQGGSETELARGSMAKSLILFLWDEAGLARYAGLGFANFNNFRGLWGFQLPLVV